MGNLPTVSVVITTLNEEKHIADCLESIQKQSYPTNKIEVILVDNNSKDNTKQIAKKYTDFVFDYGPERSAQRNFGLNLAKGKYLMYLDADMILSKDVIKNCVKTVEKDPDIAGIYISEIVMGDSFWSQVRRFERSFYDGTVVDCVRFFPKEIFNKVKGFDATMTGPEDWDFDKKVRQQGKTTLIKTPIYHNEAEFNLKKYLLKKGYYAKSFDKYINKWGKDDPDIKKQFSLLYRYFQVFLENGKWKKILPNLHLFIGVQLLRFLVGLSYITPKKK